MSDVIPSAYDPENRAVLLQLTSGGDTFTKPRHVYFSIGFAEEETALNFTNQMHDRGYKTSFKYKEQSAPLPSDATVTLSLVPSEESIGEFELFLERAACPLGGKNDGWFCERIVDKVSQSNEGHS